MLCPRGYAANPQTPIALVVRTLRHWLGGSRQEQAVAKAGFVSHRISGAIASIGGVLPRVRF
jgi:hypothetical protein